MSKAEWAAQRTTAERRAARKNISLVEVAIQPATRQRYFAGVSRLLPFLDGVQSEEELDDTIAEWVEQEFSAGAPLHMISDALCGLHHFQPWTRKLLAQSWRLFEVWRKYEVPMRAPPLTEDVLFGYVGKLFMDGDLVMAALLILGFHTMMRTHEMLEVRPENFLLGPTTGIVTVPKSKSGQRHNTMESIAIYDLYTLELVRLMVAELKAKGGHKSPCWDSTGTKFREKFYQLADFFGIRHLGLKCYSIRRGGATRDFQQHGLMERTLIRGRWASTQVARLYITDARSQIPTLTISAEVSLSYRGIQGSCQSSSRTSLGCVEARGKQLRSYRSLFLFRKRICNRSV